ncbi:hypothetical protein K488DRAFT_44190, partial [Vararia minispora EC-137]
YRHSGRTPAPSRHLSRPSYEITKEEIMRLLEENKADHRTTKAKALIRDNYRCMITGEIDMRSLKARLFDTSGLPPVKQIETRTTHCAHIFPESVNQNSKNEDKHDYAGHVWTIIQRFGCGELRDELAGDKMHSLKNIMTLESNIHDAFDSLELWLESTASPSREALCIATDLYEQGEPDTYNVCLQGALGHGNFHNLPEKAVFKSADPQRYELPDPRLLALHAACCKVAWMSGAAGYLEEVNDEDDQSPLDPVSAEALFSRLTDVLLQSPDAALPKVSRAR